MSSGSAALRRYAPAAADALDAVVAATWTTAAAHGVLGTVDRAATRAGELLGTSPLESPVASAHVDTGSRPDDGAGTILGFAEQCVLDVSAVTSDQRSAFLAVGGRASGDLAAALWVVDVVPRTRAALDALFGAGPWPDPAASSEPDLWATLDDLIRVVPALDALDPITSELVRLRGARQHNCRLCSSLRSRSALRAGADERAFAAVDDYRHSDLAPLAMAALAYTDAMIWTPGRIDSSVVTDLQSAAAPDQQVELVLDVTRNALNKIAVALGADGAHVEEGIEIYDVAPDGSLVYGLAPD
jgi:alkylhydroperoxidase family enzyme